MTSMWMVQNDDGGWLQYSGEQFYSDYGYAMKSKIAMNNWIIANPDVHAHLVELVPAKPKVPVSQEEADMLRKAGADGYSVGKTIVDFVNNAGLDTVICSDENLLQHEDRLMRAYVDGYEVTEPTKYNVKVPHTTDGYYSKRSDTDGLATWNKADSELLTRGFTQFTEAEIEHYGLEDCERVEIDTEDSDDD